MSKLKFKPPNLDEQCNVYITARYMEYSQEVCLLAWGFLGRAGMWSLCNLSFFPPGHVIIYTYKEFLSYPQV